MGTGRIGAMDVLGQGLQYRPLSLDTQRLTMFGREKCALRLPDSTPPGADLARRSIRCWAVGPLVCACGGVQTAAPPGGPRWRHTAAVNYDVWKRRIHYAYQISTTSS
jgi:hypothetical protein